MSKPNLTAERLRELLDYDPLTGIFTWKRRATGNNKFFGRQAGTVTGAGYVQIRIDRCSYRASRLVWLHTQGRWPIFLIDHENRVRTDNCLSNLREATTAQNAQNKQCYAKSGYMGVTAHKRRWKAAIELDGVREYLGLFATPALAHEAYLAAKRRLHPFCAL